MAFVAITEMRLNGADGEHIVIGPGEVVPGFETWGIHQRRAHLSLHKVREVLDHEVEAPASEEDAKAQEAEGVFCPHCPNKSFASKRGLAIHIGQQHR